MLSRSDIRRSFAFEETEISSSEAEEEEEEEEDEFLFDEEDEIMEVEVDEEARDDEEDEDDGDVVVLDKNKGQLLSKHNSSTTTVAEIGKATILIYLKNLKFQTIVYGTYNILET